MLSGPIPERNRSFLKKHTALWFSCYQYLTEKLGQLTNGGPSNNIVVIAHLGSGASLAAIFYHRRKPKRTQLTNFGRTSGYDTSVMDAIRQEIKRKMQLITTILNYEKTTADRCVMAHIKQLTEKENTYTARKT
jgi:hypothetical protein